MCTHSLLFIEKRRQEAMPSPNPTEVKENGSNDDDNDSSSSGNGKDSPTTGHEVNKSASEPREPLRNVHETNKRYQSY